MECNENSSCPFITREELSKHNSKRSCWICIGNQVLDVTSFLRNHPGGGDIILKYAGRDATKAFNDVKHSMDAKKLLEKYRIGFLDHFQEEPVPSEDSSDSGYFKQYSVWIAVGVITTAVFVASSIYRNRIRFT